LRGKLAWAATAEIWAARPRSRVRVPRAGAPISITAS